jgi:hypothetical protein
MSSNGDLSLILGVGLVTKLGVGLVCEESAHSLGYF